MYSLQGEKINLLSKRGLTFKISLSWHKLTKCSNTMAYFFNICKYFFLFQQALPTSVIRWLNYFKKTLKNLPKTIKIVPKWRNLAKSGHTGPRTNLLTCSDQRRRRRRMRCQHLDIWDNLIVAFKPKRLNRETKRYKTDDQTCATGGTQKTLHCRRLMQWLQVLDTSSFAYIQIVLHWLDDIGSVLP